MRKISQIFIAILLISFVSFCLLPFSESFAATTATVAATVTVQNISVSVSSGTVSYGTLSSNATKSTIAADLNDTQTATNNGNVAESFNIKGQNSANWTLDVANSTTDHYIHKFCTSTCGSPPTNFTALTTSYGTLATNIAALGTQTFDLQITTPQTSSVYTQQSVDVTVQAVSYP